MCMLVPPPLVMRTGAAGETLTGLKYVLAGFGAMFLVAGTAVGAGGVVGACLRTWINFPLGSR